MYRKMEEEIENLMKQVAEQAEQRTRARLLMTHPGVGPVTALATDVFLGDPGRFVDGKALASYVGIIPREYSSGGNQRLGRITKQGSPLLRFLWCEAGAHAVRKDPELQRFYRRKLVHKGLGRARVAVARKLGIRLWIMLRDEIDYQEFCRRGQKHQGGAACAGMLEVGNGANSHRPVASLEMPTRTAFREVCIFSRADRATLGFAISSMTSVSVASADCFLVFFFPSAATISRVRTEGPPIIFTSVQY
jgi:hypothetical protein